MRHIIGLCGPMGSGKTMAALHLADTHEFTRTRFADPLKKMLKALGLTQDQIDGANKEQPSYLLGGKTPRFAMQTIGTEWGRNLIFPDLWVRAWEMALPDADDIVVDDVRFPNEVAAIRRLGGEVIRICREGHEHSSNHASELEVECDYMLANDGRPEDLFDQLDHFLWFKELGL